MENDGNTDYRCDCPNEITGKNCEESTKFGFSYKVLTESKSWTEARDECSANGFNMTSIYNEDALAFLLTYTKYVLKVPGLYFCFTHMVVR